MINRLKAPIKKNLTLIISSLILGLIGILAIIHRSDIRSFKKYHEADCDVILVLIFFAVITVLYLFSRDKDIKPKQFSVLKISSIIISIFLSILFIGYHRSHLWAYISNSENSSGIIKALGTGIVAIVSLYFYLQRLKKQDRQLKNQEAEFKLQYENLKLAQSASHNDRLQKGIELIYNESDNLKYNGAILLTSLANESTEIYSSSINRMLYSFLNTESEKIIFEPSTAPDAILFEFPNREYYLTPLWLELVIDSIPIKNPSPTSDKDIFYPIHATKWQLFGVKFEDKKFYKSTFNQNCEINTSDFIKSSFVRCTISTSALEVNYFTDVTFKFGNLEYCTFNKSKFELTKFIRLESFSNNKFNSRTKFIDASFSDFILPIEHCQFQSSIWRKRDKSKNIINIEKIKFSVCDFCDSEFTQIIFDNVKINNVDFTSARFIECTITNLKIEDKPEEHYNISRFLKTTFENTKIDQQSYDQLKPLLPKYVNHKVSKEDSNFMILNSTKK